MEDVSREEIDKSLALESDFAVPSFDGKKIFIRLNKAKDTPSKRAVVIGHGFTGKPEEALHQVAPVAKMPIESCLGDAEIARQQLNMRESVAGTTGEDAGDRW